MLKAQGWSGAAIQGVPVVRSGGSHGPAWRLLAVASRLTSVDGAYSKNFSAGCALPLRLRP